VTPPGHSLREWLRSVARGQVWPDAPGRGPSHFDGLDVERRIIDCWRPVVDGDLPDADVVVATWWETAEWVAALGASKGAKACLVQGYEVFDYLPVERVKATWRLPMHRIAVSRWLVEIASDVYGDGEVSLVPNAVDVELFTAPPRGKQDEPTVGLVYSTDRCKGVDVSLRAFELARRRLPSLRLVAFGKDAPRRGLALPEGTRYALRPPQRAIKGIYAACDAWLFGSRAEGFGLPILEAMACRTPVIGTPAGAAPELLSGGGGLLVEHENPEQMAQAILAVCGMQEAEWRSMSDAAWKTATRYTWDDAAELFEAALHRAIERTQRGELAVISTKECLSR